MNDPVAAESEGDPTGTRSGASLVVAALEAAGIRRIFGIPGEESTAMMVALAESPIEFVLTRHEQAAAFMASTYGRITGIPAGCLATLGPGALNLVNGVADAQLDGVPLVAITAQGDRPRLDLSQSHQIIDLDALFAPITKSSQTIMTASAIPGAVAEAVRLAKAERPGAVHLSLPVDLANEQVTGAPVAASSPAKVIPDPAQIVRALCLLNRSELPVIVAGPGVLRSAAVEPLRKLAEAANIPVVTTFMAKGVLPAEHPLCLFSVGQPFADHIDTVLEAADLILAVGYDAVEYAPADLAEGTDVLHIAELPAAHDLGLHLASEVTGDIAAALRGITAGLNGASFAPSPKAADLRRKMLAEREAEAGSAGDSMRGESILRVVEAQLTKQDRVISGVGLHKMKIARSLSAKFPGQIVIANGLAGMGMALPGAIAAAMLEDTDHALAICGDGDLLMNVQDMETAARLKLRLTVMVWVDGNYGLIEAKQQDEIGHHTGLSFCDLDWPQLATAFDWRHIGATDLDEVARGLAAARAATEPVLLTVPVDYQAQLRPQA